MGQPPPGSWLTTHTTHNYHAYHAYHALFPSPLPPHWRRNRPGFGLTTHTTHITRHFRRHLPPHWRRNRPGFGLTTHTTHITRHFRRPLPATLESKSPWVRTYHAYHAYHAPFPSATSRHVGVEIALDSDLSRISRAISVGHFPPRWSRNHPGFGLTTHTTHITRHFRRHFPPHWRAKYTQNSEPHRETRT